MNRTHSAETVRRRALTDAIAEQIASAYRLMASKAHYRPAAPSDGFGNVTGRLDLAAETREYAEAWWDCEDCTDYLIGCPSYEDRRALIYAVEGARVLCGGGIHPAGRRTAATLLRMAADALDAARV